MPNQPESKVVSLSDVKKISRGILILGVIGGEEQRDRLFFVSLICQIDAGLDKEYKE